MAIGVASEGLREMLDVVPLIGLSRWRSNPAFFDFGQSLRPTWLSRRAVAAEEDPGKPLSPAHRR